MTFEIIAQRTRSQRCNKHTPIRVTLCGAARGNQIADHQQTLRALITRFDAAQQTDLANVIQAYFGDFMTTYRQDFTALVGQAGEQVSGIYEIDYREFNRDTYARGREAFDRTWAEVKELLIGTWWRDQQMMKEAE